MITTGRGGVVTANKKAEGIEDHVIHVITSRPQEVDKKMNQTIIEINIIFFYNNYVVKGKHHNTIR